MLKNYHNPTSELKRLQSQANIASMEMKLLIEAGLPTHGKIVDIGCGPGYYAERIKKSNSELEIIGIDSDPVILEEARTRIKTVQADACSLPFEDNVFDGSIARFVLQHIQNPQLAVKEMVRVVKPGGVIIIIDTDNDLWLLDPEPALFSQVFSAYKYKAQQKGADPFIGRKLYRLLKDNSISNIHVGIHPITSCDIGTENFVQTILSGITMSSTDDELISKETIDVAQKNVISWGERDGSFGIVTVFLASGNVPISSHGGLRP